MTDEDLVLRLLEGDERAFEMIYDRHGGGAWSLARRLLDEREVAEELVQEAFLAVWNQAGQYSSTRGTVRTWILAIVHHLAVDRLRRRAADARPAKTPSSTSPPLRRTHQTRRTRPSRASRPVRSTTRSGASPISNFRFCAWRTTAATPITKSPRCCRCRWGLSRAACAWAWIACAVSSTRRWSACDCPLAIPQMRDCNTLGSRPIHKVRPEPRGRRH